MDKLYAWSKEHGKMMPLDEVRPTLCDHLQYRGREFGCPTPQRHCSTCSKGCDMAGYWVVTNDHCLVWLRDAGDPGRWKFCPYCGQEIPEKLTDLDKKNQTWEKIHA